MDAKGIGKSADTEWKMLLGRIIRNRKRLCCVSLKQNKKRRKKFYETGKCEVE